MMFFGLLESKTTQQRRLRQGIRSDDGHKGAGCIDNQLGAGEGGGKVVERKRSQEVAAHAGFDLIERTGRSFDP